MATRLTASFGGALINGVCSLHAMTMPRAAHTTSFDLLRDGALVARDVGDMFTVDQPGAYQVVRFDGRGVREESNIVVVRADQGGGAPIQQQQVQVQQGGMPRWLRWLLGILGGLLLLLLLWWLLTHLAGPVANAWANVTVNAASQGKAAPVSPGPPPLPADPGKPVSTGIRTILTIEEAETLITSGTAVAFLDDEAARNLAAKGETVRTTTVRGKHANFLTVVSGGRKLLYYWSGQEDPEMGVFHFWERGGGA